MTSREFWILVILAAGCSRETRFAPHGGDEEDAGPQIVRVATVDWPEQLAGAGGLEQLAGAGGLEELEQLAGGGGLEELEQLAGGGGLEELEQLAGAGGLEELEQLAGAGVLEELEQLAGAGGLEQLAGAGGLPTGGYSCGMRCDQPGGVCRLVTSDIPGGCEQATSHPCLGADIVTLDPDWGAYRCCADSGFPDAC